MPDASTIREIVSGGVGVVALVVLCLFAWFSWKERTSAQESAAIKDDKFLATMEHISEKAQMALNRNTEAIEKLESAVDKLELRIDAHDRILSSDRRSG